MVRGHHEGQWSVVIWSSVASPVARTSRAAHHQVCVLVSAGYSHTYSQRGLTEEEQESSTNVQTLNYTVLYHCFVPTVLLRTPD